jgi:hypothetical protein
MYVLQLPPLLLVPTYTNLFVQGALLFYQGKFFFNLSFFLRYAM